MEGFEIISRWRDSTSNPRCEVNSEIENHISDAEEKRGEPSKKENAATWLRGNLQKLDDGPITLLVEGNYLERVEMVATMWPICPKNLGRFWREGSVGAPGTTHDL